MRLVFDEIPADAAGLEASGDDRGVQVERLATRRESDRFFGIADRFKRAVFVKHRGFCEIFLAGVGLGFATAKIHEPKRKRFSVPAFAVELQHSEKVSRRGVGLCAQRKTGPTVAGVEDQIALDAFLSQRYDRGVGDRIERANQLNRLAKLFRKLDFFDEERIVARNSGENGGADFKLQILVLGVLLDRQHMEGRVIEVRKNVLGGKNYRKRGGEGEK